MIDPNALEGGRVRPQRRRTRISRYCRPDSARLPRRYWKSGALTSDTQTAYALALCFDLLLPEDVPAAGRRLVELVRDAGHTIATGFVGTPLILDALTIAGAIDDAYRLLMQTECPSWLYTVEMGATTIWERWTVCSQMEPSIRAR